MRRGVGAIVTAGLMAAASITVPAVAGADVTGAQIVSYLNAQRAAQGFPSDIAEDTTLSDACRKHDVYGATNNDLTHDESSSKPGYTAEGAQVARQSVIYHGQTWTAAANPFESSPIHLMQTLSPYIDRLGAYETQGYGCASTLASLKHAPAATDTAFTYPRNGAGNWPVSEAADEGPFPPGATIGIPAGSTTGPYLMVLFSGPGLSALGQAKVLSASLTGPAGPVDIATFDPTSPQVGPYLPLGAQILPKAPLAAATTYTASLRARVTADDGSTREIATTWSFATTGAAAPDPVKQDPGTQGSGTQGSGGKAGGTPAPCRTRLSRAKVHGGARRYVSVRATACAPATIRLTLRRHGSRVGWASASVQKGTHTIKVYVPRGLGRGSYSATLALGKAKVTLTVRVAG